MSDVATSNAVPGTDNQGTVSSVEVTTDVNKTQSVNEPVIQDQPAPIDPIQDLKNFYMKELDTIKKDIKGKDQKITELQRILNQKKAESLTDEQKRELEKRQIRDEYHNLYIQQTVAEYNLKQYDPDMDFSGFFYSDKENPEEMQIEMKEKGKALNDYILKAIKTGIEKGVNEKLTNGSYIPKTAASGNPSDLKGMSREQIIEKTKEVQKMPQSPEKTKILNDLMSEQMRRITE